MSIAVDPTKVINGDNVDLLDRQPFIDQLISIVETLSAQKKNACFAVNGSWGVGKSYVLERFKKEIELIHTEQTTLTKYLVFNYNCWQYDYYEEPLVAIIAAMLDAIDEQVYLLPRDIKIKVKTILYNIGSSLLMEACHIFEEKTGIALQKMEEVLKDTARGTEDNLREAHSFDPHFDFKKTLMQLRKTIAALAKDQTVIFIVDELDRCLPEYTIRILERLHHLFDDVPNVQVILSTDKGQLEYTVKQIFGSAASTERYLAKFIDFELKLDTGTVKGNFCVKFEQYVSNFSIQYQNTHAADLDEFTSLILEGLDVRTRIAIIEKCHLLHQLTTTVEEMDSVYMCIEMFLAVLKYCDLDVKLAWGNFNIRDIFGIKRLPGDVVHGTFTTGLNQFGKKYADSAGESTYFETDGRRQYIKICDIWGMLLGVYRYILGERKDYWLNGYADTVNMKVHAQKFWELLQIIN